MKTCGRCNVDQPLSEYWRHAGTADGLRPVCKSCTRIVNREWRAANLDRHRARDRRNHRRNRWRKWGLSNDDIAAIFTGRCEACGVPVDLGEEGRRATADLDHDHSCCPGKHGCPKCVRGFLCRRCNLVAGVLESGAADLVAAYLKRRAA